MKKFCNKIMKLLMVVCMLFSQFLFVGKVFADTLNNQNEKFSVILNNDNTITVIPTYENGESDKLGFNVVEKFKKYTGEEVIINEQNVGNTTDNIITKESILPEGKTISLLGNSVSDVGVYFVFVTVTNLNTSTSLGTVVVSRDYIGSESGLLLTTNLSNNSLSIDAVDKNVKIDAFVLPGSLKDGINYTVSDNNTTNSITGSRSEIMFKNFGTTIDFTNKLYGQHVYNYSINVTGIGNYNESIAINYGKVNDNDQILNANDLNINFKEGTANIFAALSENNILTVKKVKDSIKKVYLNQGFEAVVKDSSNVVISDDNRAVTNGMIIEIVSDSLTISYDVIMKADYEDNNNSYDGVVKDFDIDSMINSALDSNYDVNKIGDVDYNSRVDVFDVVKTINSLAIGTWTDNYQQSSDVIFTTLSNENSVIRQGDIIEVKLNISGLINDYINGIQGIINFDNSLLSLVNVSFSNSDWYGNYYLNNGKINFIYAGETAIYERGVILTLTFDVLDSGSSSISVEDIIFVKDNVSLSKERINDLVISFLESNNNNLQSLIIENYDIGFTPDNTYYEINVSSDVMSLNLSLVAEDENATIEIVGNDNFKDGQNIVKIIVTAADGSVKEYRIIVNKSLSTVDNNYHSPSVTYMNVVHEVEEIAASSDGLEVSITEEDNDEKDDKSTKNEKTDSSKIIIIILILLVIGGLVYLIFKDDEEENEIINDKNNKSKNKK